MNPRNSATSVSLPVNDRAPALPTPTATAPGAYSLPRLSGQVKVLPPIRQATIFLFRSMRPFSPALRAARIGDISLA